MSDLSSGLDQIEARVNNATPGPWLADEGEEGYEVSPPASAAFSAPWSDEMPHPGFVPNYDPCSLTEEQRDQIIRDEQFFAWARTDLPRLIAVIRAAQKECSEKMNADADLGAVEEAEARAFNMALLRVEIVMQRAWKASNE
jgi:hypothetical protein